MTTPSQTRRRRPRNVVARLALEHLPVDVIAPLIVKDVLLRAAQMRNALPHNGAGLSLRKSLRKSLERTEFPWLSRIEQIALVDQCLRLLAEAVHVEGVLRGHLTLAEVAKLEGTSEDELRMSLEDPAVRQFYAWPEYNPRTREVSFSAARFDHAARSHLVVPLREPHAALHPTWRKQAG